MEGELLDGVMGEKIKGGKGKGEERDEQFKKV